MRFSAFFLILLVALMQSSVAHSQVKRQKFKVYVHQGDSARGIGNNYGAHRAYKNALDLKDDVDVAFKCAEVCRGYQNYTAAEDWYRYVLDRDSTEYKHAAYWYAEMLKFNQKYDEAADAFHNYAIGHVSDKDYFYKKAMHEAIVCRDSVSGVKSIHHDKDINVTHLPDKINTMYAELAPVVYMDSVLFYTAIKPLKRDSNTYFTKIYSSRLVNGVWQKPKECESVNDEQSMVTNLAFAFDSVTAFFNKCMYDIEEGRYNCKIYEAKYIKDEFKNVKPLPNTINYPRSNTSAPSLVKAKDGNEYMFFVSDRPGGIGRQDIWYAQRYSNGRFSKPVNVGKRINTPGNEVTPFYDMHDSTLYFSSEMHVSLGGYDVFKAKGDLQRNRFSDAVNMGTPVNSSYNDIYYRYSSDSLYAYFVSNRIGSTRFVENAFGNDIYNYKLIKKAKVYLKGIVPFSIYFDNDQPDPKSIDTVTDMVYNDLVIPYLAKKPDYLKQFKKRTTKEQEKYYTELIEDRFEFDIAKGWENLQKFVSIVDFLLHDGQDIVVTFKGYSSNLHTAEYNKRLAQRRIVSVKNYFLSYKGGVLRKFLDNESGTGEGSLKLIEVALGIVRADNTFMVNGEQVDIKKIGPIGVREKVYGPSAILQRKIEILAVKTDNEEQLEEMKRNIEESKKLMIKDEDEDGDEIESVETPVEEEVVPEVEETELPQGELD